MKNEEIIINRALNGDCPICGKNITDKVTLKPIAEAKPAMFEGFKVFICAHHPNAEVEHAVSALRSLVGICTWRTDVVGNHKNNLNGSTLFWKEVSGEVF